MQLLRHAVNALDGVHSAGLGGANALLTDLERSVRFCLRPQHGRVTALRAGEGARLLGVNAALAPTRAPVARRRPWRGGCS